MLSSLTVLSWYITYSNLNATYRSHKQHPAKTHLTSWDQNFLTHSRLKGYMQPQIYLPIMFCRLVNMLHTNIIYNSLYHICKIQLLEIIFVMVAAILEHIGHGWCHHSPNLQHCFISCIWILFMLKYNMFSCLHNIWKDIIWGDVSL